MKSHDILILLKLLSLDGSPSSAKHYTFRALGASLGLSPSAVSNSLKNSYSIGLLQDNKINRKNLLEFIIYALRYVFPAKLGTLTRGIATCIHTLRGSGLLSAGDLIYVWPCQYAKRTGLSFEPLYKTVPQAIETDLLLYELLICVDSIRIGRARERNFAISHLKKSFSIIPICRYRSL